MVEYVNYDLPKSRIQQMFLMQGQLKTFGVSWFKIIYEGVWEATSEELPIRCIKCKLRQINYNCLQTIMAEIKTKLKSIAQ